MSRKLSIILGILVAIGALFLFFHFFVQSDADISIPEEANNIAPVDIIPTSTPVVATTSQPAPIITEPTLTTTTATTTTTPKIIKLIVPFTAQAPFGEWSDPRQQNGCEEASALIAVSWARGKTFTLQEAKDTILAISDWELEKYGSYQDASAADTVKRIFNEYFDFHQAEVVNNITLQDIINELQNGNLVVIPANGQAIHNRFFQVPGPDEHMTVIIGYDYQTKEFITNDPGTRQGKNYRYDQEVLFNAIRDYPTGNHLPIKGVSKVMIVVKK